jgi:TP901 family phage tail tape measure protein
MGAGEKVLRVIIAGDALGAVTALGELSHGLSEAHSEADKHGGGITSALGGAAKGIGLFAAGAVGAAALVADEFYKIGSGYEQNLNAIQAFTHSTDAQMKTLEDRLYSMSPQFAQMGQTVGDASDALYALTKAGANSTDAMTELTPTMALAKATNTDFTESANEVTRMLNAFGLKASDSATVADTLTNATHTSTQTLQDMTDGLKYVSVAAHDFGLNIQTTAGVMAMYANAGLNGTQAGTAFRAMLVNLSAPTKAARDGMKAIGLEAFDAKGKLKPLGDIFQQLQDKFGKGLDDHSLQQIAPYLKDIFGTRGVEPILAAIKQGGGGLQQYVALMNRTGEASAIAQAKSKGLSGTFNELRATVESTVQHLYMQVAPKLAAFLQPMVAALPGALSKFGKFGKQAWDAFNQGASGGGTGGTSGMGAVFASAGEFVRNILIPEVKQIGQIFVRDVIPIVKDGLRIFEALAPVVMHIVQALAKDLAPILRDIGKFVEKDILPSFKKLSTWIATDLVPKIDKMWSKLQPILAMLAQWIDQKIIPLLDQTWQKLQPVFAQLGKLINSLMDSLTGLLGVLKPVLSWLLNVLGGPVIGVLKGLIDGLIQLAKGVIEVFQGMLDFFTGIFTGNWSKAWNGIKEQTAGLFNALIGFIKVAVFGKMLKLAGEGFKAIADAVTGALDGIGSFFEDFWGKAGKLWSGSIQGIKMIWSLLWRNVKDDFVDFATSNWRDFSTWAGKLFDWFTALPGKLLYYLRSAGSWLITSGLDLLEGLLNGVERGAVNTWNWLKALPGAVKGWFSDVGNWLIDAGWNMIMGMVNGIQQAAGHLKDVSIAVVKDAYEGVKSFLGINSPSRLYIGVGSSQGEGAIKGVQAKAAAVHDAILSMVSPPASKFSAAFRKQSQMAASAAAANARNAGQLWGSTGAPGGAQGGYGPAVTVTINVAGSIQAEKDFAKKMATAIRDEIRQIGRRNGGSTGLNGIA